MTYNVFGGTLNLTQSINQSVNNNSFDTVDHFANSSILPINNFLYEGQPKTSVEERANSAYVCFGENGSFVHKKLYIFVNLLSKTSYV